MKKILLVILLMFSMLPIFAKEKIEMSNNDFGIYVFKIDTNKYGNKIKPYMTPVLTTPKKLYEDECFDLVVNGGFFDVKNGKTVSYVTIDNELVGDVKKYTELVEKLAKEDRLEKVLSRGELRIYEKRNKLKFDIAYHTDPLKKGWTLKHALQAGPIIAPDMDLVKEGFVIYEGDIVKSQSVDILKRRERTAIGLKGKYLYIVAFTSDKKVDAYEMRDYMTKALKLDKVLALDGGLSTAVSSKDVSFGSLGKYQRKVKSFLVVER